MSEQVIKVETEGKVRTITFNRPDKLNAFNDALYDAVRDALYAANDDPGVAGVILTGEGRAYCAGMDLGDMDNRPEYPEGEAHGFGPFMDALDTFSKPLIAAVNGVGVGIGLTMLPYCDAVVIDEKARLRAPFVHLGVTAEAASTYLLPLTIGWANTADILYTARFISAENAVEIGLAREVAPNGNALTRAKEIAAEIAKGPVDSLKATKGLLIAKRLEACRDARVEENKVFGALEGGPANKEALKAFSEKRAPDFSKL